MRQSERGIPDAEFPTLYALNETRFSGGREHIFNGEDEAHEPADDFT